jgi:predicted ester cyclase
LSKPDLPKIYRDYIDCLNRQDWSSLSRFVHDDVHHNGRALGVSGYRKMLEADFEAIPDLHFDVRLLIADPPHVACRLHFDCTPSGMLFGLPVNGRRVQFSENVFYTFEGEKIEQVWSVIDTAAINEQL